MRLSFLPVCHADCNFLSSLIKYRPFTLWKLVHDGDVLSGSRAGLCRVRTPLERSRNICPSATRTKYVVLEHTGRAVPADYLGSSGAGRKAGNVAILSVRPGSLANAEGHPLTVFW